MLFLGMTALATFAQYQFPNSTFDADFISSYGSYTEPEGWHGYATIDASSLNSAGRSGEKLVASTGVRSGASGKCVYIKATSIMGVVANGVMTNGQIYTHSTTATDGSQNYNFSDPNNTGSTSTYGANNQFFTPFTGRPDSIRVWLKNTGTGNAKVSVYTHKAGTVMYDPTNNVTDASIIVAHAEKAIPACDWTQYSIPFYYSSTSDPGLILATFSTNVTPGGGANGDMLYIDDIEIVYVSEMVDPTYNGSPIQFVNGVADIDAGYNSKWLKYTTGAGADVTVTEPTADNNYTLTINIKGNDLSVNPTNEHTYVMHFTGIASGNDDEPSVVVVPETTPSARKLVTGTSYYIRSVKYGTYLDHSNNLTTTPQRTWTISSDKVYDADNHYLQVYRTNSWNQYTSVDYSNFPIKSSNADEGYTMAFTQDGANVLKMYRNVGAYYTTGLFGIKSQQNADIYVGANSATTLYAYDSSADAAEWSLCEMQEVNRIYGFWQTYTSATLLNGINASDFVYDGCTIATLPLGVYEITGSGSMTVEGVNTFTSASGKFYLPSESIVSFSGTPTLTYYGRLDFSLSATYDGVAISDGSTVDDVYDSSKLSVTLAGNGQQSYSTFFDEDTYQLTITISGYGRSRDHVIQFAAPDLSLNATWYGERVTDGQTIDEAYDATQLVVTPGTGASLDTSYNSTTGVLTITLSSSTDSQTYTLQFAIIPETVSTQTYSPLTALINGSSTSSTGMAFAVATLDNSNISFTVSGVTGLGNLTATNLSLDKKGNFHYYGELRASATSQKTPVTIYGQLVDGQLTASADVKLSNTSLLHATYGIATVSTANYTDDLVVTINGDATTVPSQTIMVGTLENDNINFTLTNFQMSLNGATAYIGNIFLENLPIDADGNFEFEGGILIGPGTDSSKEWGGLDLGIVPIVMRGQAYDYNGTMQLIDIIDIDMQASLGQTIHVTFGAEAVSSRTYVDDLIVSINGESTTVPETSVVVGTLKNGNINFSLKNFQMQVNGATSYIGNVAIDNIAVDESGNFTYSGTIRIGKGDLAGVTSWGGPDLGDVPVVIRGSIFDQTDGNSSDGTSQCVMVLDIDMQASLGQTIHVTFGAGAVTTREYTDVLAVTVNGEQTTQDATVTVGFLGNGNINFTLDNFSLDTNGTSAPIGSISIENLIVDSDGRFSYDGTIRIGKGSDPTVTSWGGPDLGDVPVVMNGQMYRKNGINYLLVAIDIDMEASIGQTINVTFGATPVSSKTYTDDLAVTVNGETTTMQATVTVGTLKNGYINFILNNFQMQLNGSTAYIGNVAINALEVGEDGKFSYTGNVRIGEGDLAGVESWGGPDLGAIPMVMKGQFYTYNKTEYLIVSIDINMEESIGQTIGVLFGGTPISTREYTDVLAVTINEQTTYMPNTTVTVGTLRNGNINFTLKNFMLRQENSEQESPIGNIALNNLELDAEGNFSYTGNVRIGNGDAAGVTSWGGPDLGAVPVVLTGKLRSDDVYVNIDIDMMSTLSQIINVVFGAEFEAGDINGDGKITVGDMVGLIEILLEHATDVHGTANVDMDANGRVNITDVDALIVKILR